MNKRFNCIFNKRIFNTKTEKWKHVQNVLNDLCEFSVNAFIIFY